MLPQVSSPSEIIVSDAIMHNFNNDFIGVHLKDLIKKSIGHPNKSFKTHLMAIHHLKKSMDKQPPGRFAVCKGDLKGAPREVGGSVCGQQGRWEVCSTSADLEKMDKNTKIGGSSARWLEFVQVFVWQTQLVCSILFHRRMTWSCVFVSFWFHWIGCSFFWGWDLGSLAAHLNILTWGTFGALVGVDMTNCNMEKVLNMEHISVASNMFKLISSLGLIAFATGCCHWKHTCVT